LNGQQPIPDAQWQTAFDKLFGASSDRSLIIGRLGVKTSSSSANLAVAERRGYYYVSIGLNGELGQSQARDGVGVSLTAWQVIWMVRENNELVICRATSYGGGAGGSGNLDGLTDVTLSSPTNGQTLQYNSTSGQWVNATVSGGGGGATILDGLTDVTITAPAAKQTLYYNTGTAQWINRLLAYTDLDFTASDLSSITTRPHSALTGINPNDHHHIAQSGAGITVSDYLTQVIDINLASGSGLLTTGGLHLDPLVAGLGLTLTSGVLDVGFGPGIAVNANNIAINLAATSGLTLTGGVLAAGAGDGIDVLTATIAVDVTDFIDTAAGLREDAANNIQVRLETNSGFQFGGAGGVQLGTPSTLSVSSANSVTAATHSHAVTSSSDQQFGGAALLASNASGQLALAQLTLRGPLIFAGGDQHINASNVLYLTPSSDLILDPGGLVLAPNAQDIRTVTINDLPTGIDGFRLWNRYANYTQLTIGAIKADELYVRVFAADETRIDRGEEYWSKSFGIVQADFVVPPVGQTVDVWFEDAPGMSGFNLFSVNDYLLMRTIDWATGLVVQKTWWQVTTAKLAQETTAANGVDRQQWRIRRMAGGISATTIKRGGLALDSGQVGQGWIHLSALSQDGGPFIQIGAMTSVASSVPQFTNYVRMGNLNGTVDYSSNVYGFAAGSSLGTTPSGGFSGMTAEATNGLRLFNTTLELYESANKVVRLAAGTGLAFEKNSLGVTSAQVAWYDDLGAVAGGAPPGTPMASISLGRALAAVENTLNISSGSGGVGGNLGSILLAASQSGAQMSLYLEPLNLHIFGTTTTSGSDLVTVTAAGLVGIGVPSPTSRLHIAANGSNDGIYVTNPSAGGPFLTLDATSPTVGNRYAGTFLSSAGTQQWYAGIRFGDGKFYLHDAVNNQTRQIWQPNGMVGIGLLSPTYRLHIAANGSNDGLYVSNPSTGGPYLYLDATAATVGNRYAGMQLLSNGTPQWLAGLRFGDGNFYIYDFVNNLNSMTFQPGGNVGIGTTPTALLHLYSNHAGTGLTTGQIIEQAGSGDALLHFLLTGGQRWIMGIDNSDLDKFKISNNAVLGSGDVFVIDTAGNVGIGTAAPAVLLDMRKGGAAGLTIGTTTDTSGSLVEHQLLTNGSDVVMQFHVYDTLVTGSRFGQVLGGWAEIVAAGSNLGGLVIGTNTADPMLFGTSALERMRIDSTGRVGVNNLSPSAILDVGGVIRTTGISGAPTTGTGLQMYYNPGGAGFGSIAVYAPATPAYSELRIDGSLLTLNPNTNGQVGVATSNPFGALGVEASAIAGISSAIFSSNFATFQNPSQAHFVARSARGTKSSISATASGDTILAIEGFGYNSSGAWMTTPSVAIYGRTTQAFNSGQTNGGAALDIYVRANSVLAAPGTPAVTVDQTGEVFITGNLTVNNGNAATGYVKAINLGTSGNTVALAIDTSTAPNVARDRLVKPTSSIRFKKDLRPLPAVYGTEFVMKLVPRLFKFRGPHDSPPPNFIADLAQDDHIGLIAEEVLDVGGKDFVIFDEEERAESLRYDRFVTPLIAAMQQQQGRIVELERRLAELERRLIN
jgi:hypothetical protein